MPDRLRYPKTCRVRKRPEYLRIQTQGRKLRSSCFLLSILPLSERAIGTLGITVTKKLHKSAVRRNRLKRRIREIYRHTRQEFRYPAEMVVIGLNGSMELTSADIRRELYQLWTKAKLLSASRDGTVKKSKSTEGSSNG